MVKIHRQGKWNKSGENKNNNVHQREADEVDIFVSNRPRFQPTEHLFQICAHNMFSVMKLVHFANGKHHSHVQKYSHAAARPVKTTKSLQETNVAETCMFHQVLPILD